MCNFFGSGCAGGTEFDLKRYSEQAQRESDAMRAMTNTPAYLQSMAGQANCFKEAPKRIKKGWLTQEDIDNGTGPAAPVKTSTWRDKINRTKVTYFSDGSSETSPDTPWLSGVPGGWLTLAVLISFCLGMWALWGLWGMKEMVSTAIKG